MVQIPAYNILVLQVGLKLSHRMLQRVLNPLCETFYTTSTQIQALLQVLLSTVISRLFFWVSFELSHSSVAFRICNSMFTYGPGSNGNGPYKSNWTYQYPTWQSLLDNNRILRQLRVETTGTFGSISFQMDSLPSPWVYRLQICKYFWLALLLLPTSH